MVFDGFHLSRVELDDVTLRVRSGGSGPPLLLLHGYPQTHLMWARVAGELAREFTVVAPDLRGYGRSTLPDAGREPDEPAAAKRAMARDAVGLMRRLGFDRFDVAGHDRGGRVAYRTALDHPDAVRRLSVLDIIPTGEVWARADHRFALGYWHWSFLAQPAPFPETVISADPEMFLFRAQFGGRIATFDAQAYADYAACSRDPAVVHAMCEDYRAGAGFDRRLDLRDRADGRTIDCPVQVLWGARGALPGWYDVLDVWRTWAPDVRGQAVDCGHFLPEEAPEETARLLREFFAAP